MKTRLLSAVLGCLAAAMPAQTPSPETAARVADITAKFQAAFDRDAAGPHKQALLDLDRKYLGAVNRAQEAAAQAGNLDEALALRGEVQRVVKGEPLPPVDLDSLPASLKQLRVTYREAVGRFAAERDLKAQPLYDHYERLLEALQTELTKAGRIDDALVVKTRRENVALDRPKVAAATPPEPASAPVPEAASADGKKAAASGGAVALKGSPWRAVAEWVISLKGRLEIVKDGQKRGVEKEEQLPVGKFDVTRVEFSRYYPNDGKKMNEADLALLNPVAKTLERLILEQCNITGDGLRAIAGAPRLTKVSLFGSRVTDDALQHLAKLPQLAELDVNGTLVTGTGLAGLRALPRLKELAVDGTKLSPQGGQALALLTGLEKFSAGTVNFRGDGTSITQPLAGLMKLKDISFGDTSPVSDVCLEPLKGLAMLEKVNFSNSRISGTGLRHLQASAASLKSVNLWYQCPVSDEALEIIAGSLPNLEILNIGYGASCGVRGLKALTSLGRLESLGWGSKGAMDPADHALFAALPALKSLSFSDCPVLVDEALEYLKGAKGLKTLNLVGTGVGDAGLRHLEGLKPLQTLRLRGCKATDLGVAAFKKARPDVTVER